MADDAVAGFLQRFGLDDAAGEFLLGLDETARLTVVSDFAPRDDTHDVAGKMYGFARSVQQRCQQATPATQMTPELEAFALRWSLDNAAVAWLAELPPEVSSILAEQFEPKEDTQNVIGKMRGFARSIQARRPSAVARPPAAEALPRRLEDFALKWGLDDRSLALLRALPGPVQATVAEQFDPKGDVVNVNGKLCAFARSIAAQRQSADVAEAFADHWRLDETARQFLRGLPEDIKSKVVQQFDPSGDTRDVSAKLKTFARGVVSSGGHGPAHGQGGRRLVEDSSLDLMLEGGSEQAQIAAEAAGDAAIAEFVVRWSLDSSSVALLESLPEDARDRVLADFDPRGNTRNVGAKLRAFANTVLDGKGSRGPPQPTSEAPARSGASSLLTGAEMAFLEKWGLQLDQTAVDVLARLTEPVRLRVMREFGPKEDTANMLGKFCGFANSVSRAAASGRGPAAPARGLPPLAVPSAYRGAAPGRSFVPAAPAYANRGGHMSADQFANKWQLDEGSRAMLRGMDPEAQAAVISEFQPRGDTRDLSGKFCAFARSIASRLRTPQGGGYKRPYPGGRFGGGPPPLRPRFGGR